MSDKKSGDQKPAGSGSPDEAPSGSPTELELQIQARREHLAATIDELTTRAQPKEIARRSAAALSDRFQTVTHTPEGELRSERVAAVAGAFVVIAGALIFIRGRG
ncbi:hypothetical protein GCM10022223_04010 [Kineosporia mesophila]|uniref:DUF3618 domain-containing protein n=1 Tax=Kineosporia mesophila TaxID=566012 RepID=A0ABP6YXD8_9ACTN|nr:DUF3618 domain-containing protein [Kineosporia mesophila]MCD5351881.1 DUF3618 domain-containing protein [Kineosporia mesophila]